MCSPVFLPWHVFYVLLENENKFNLGPGIEECKMNKERRKKGEREEGESIREKNEKVEKGRKEF